MTLTPSRDIQRLIEIMAALRTPVTGCPWDLAQNFASIAPYTLEEAYEVADAIERRDLVDLQDELGDLLLQVVYHARMAEEAGAFSFGDVVEGVTRKMIRRHPHVFGDEHAASPGDVDGLWGRIKAEERAEKAAARANTSLANPVSHAEGVSSILAGVPASLPGLSRAIKLQDKAAKVGFDWPGLTPVFDKVREELAELEEVALPLDPRRSAIPSGFTSPPSSWGRPEGGDSETARTGLSPTAPSGDPPTPGPSPRGGEGTDAAIKEEFGDLLFVLANVARHLKIDPEACLRGANQKFIRRFTHIETRLAERGSSPAQSTLEEMDLLWDEAKFLEQIETIEALEAGEDGDALT